MQKSSELYQLYLSKMESLENFRSDFHSAHSTEALEHDDPELKRLTEAMAFFSAHTEELGKRQINNLHRHLVQQIHPYVFSPLPAKTILQAAPRKLQEASALEAGTEFQLESEEGESAIFRTLYPVNLLPISCSGITVTRRNPATLDVGLSFTAFFEMNKAPGALPIYLNVLNDFAHTLTLFNSIREMTAKPSVTFNKEEKRYPVQVVHNYQDVSWLHPVEQIRNALHFPYGDFFINLDLKEAPAVWNSFTLHFTIKRNVREPELLKEYFKLFCTPIMNIKEEPAKNIKADGVRSKYVLESIETEKDLQLLSIKGVYHDRGKRPVPLIPSVLGGEKGSYALQLSDNLGPYIDINIPGSFENPADIFITAYWHRPVFSTAFSRKITVMPYSVEIPGVSWTVPRERTKYISPLEQKNALSLYEALTIHSGYEITEQFLTHLFFLFSTGWAREFDCINDSFQGFSRKGDDFYIHFDLEEEQHAPVYLFIEYFEKLVEAWFNTQGFKLVFKPDNLAGRE